jgi:hypothetical protein
MSDGSSGKSTGMGLFMSMGRDLPRFFSDIVLKANGITYSNNATADDVISNFNLKS